MNQWTQRLSGGRLLLALGSVLTFVAVVLFIAGWSARSSIAEAERLAAAHAIELANVIAALQDRLADGSVERAALRLIESNPDGEEALLETLHAVGLGSVLTAQVFQPDLEELVLGEYPSPDFTTLEILLEARRSGQAMPEGRFLSGQPAHLALARRLQSDDQVTRGILLVRLSIEQVAESVDWSTELDFIALTQGVGQRGMEIWRQGIRPAQQPARTAVPGTRFWLEWHHSTTFAAVGLREFSIMGLSGAILLLFGLRRSIPDRKLALPLTMPALLRRLPAIAASPRANSDSAAAAPIAQVPESDHSAPALEAETAELQLDETASPPAAPTSADRAEQLVASELEPDEAPAEAQADAATAPEELPIADEPPASTHEGLPESPIARESVDSEPESSAPAAADADLPRQSVEPDSAESEPLAESEASEPDSGPVRASQPSPVDPNLFTDAGILGRFDAGLDARSATLIGQAIAAAAAERGVRQIAVARDGRLHGPILINAVTQGIRSGGLDVIEFGAVPSPLLDFAALELPGQSAVMVSAGHLPADWNGLRIMLQGRLLSGASVHELLEHLRDGGSAGGQGALETASALERYVQTIAARIQLERPLKVVVDCANTVAGPVVPRLLEAIGADVVPLYADIDGAFPNHLPDPSRPEHLEDLRLCVRNFRADLGLAFGGDGDRVVAVAHDGTIVWPDKMLILLARDLLQEQPGSTIVQDALCSPRIVALIRALGGRVEISDLGAAEVAAALEASGGALGVSFAGQFFMPGEWSRGGDAMFAACRLLEILALETREVSEIMDELPSWISLPPVFLPTQSTSPQWVLDQLRASVDVNEAEVGIDNGFSLDVGKAWVRICRSAEGSGLMIRFEGDDEAAAQSLAVLVRQLLLAVDERLQIPF